MTDIKDVRCNVGPRRLFARMDRSEALLQISCPDCRKVARPTHPTLVHVLHLYNVLTGDLVQTVWQWPGGLIGAAGQTVLHLVPGEYES